VPFGFLSCEDDDLSTFVRESFEHPASFWWVRVMAAFEQNPWKNLA